MENDDDTESVGDMLNRGQFLIPSLIGDGSDSPLLDQARRNVADTVERAKRKKEEFQEQLEHERTETGIEGNENRP